MPTHLPWDSQIPVLGQPFPCDVHMLWLESASSLAWGDKRDAKPISKPRTDLPSENEALSFYVNCCQKETSLSEVWGGKPGIAGSFPATVKYTLLGTR